MSEQESSRSHACCFAGREQPTISRRHVLALAAVPVVLTACGRDIEHDDEVPYSPFDSSSTAEEVTAGLDLDGKIAVVTGCTSGIGYETMRVLALRGAYVIGTSRSLQHATEASKSIAGVTSALQLDLADKASVVDCAEQLRRLNAPIDMLICNAGYRGGSDEAQLVNGVEKHMAINHFGHFLLVNRLLDRLYRAWQGRVVTVASRAAYRSPPAEGIRFSDLSLGDDYSDSMAYAQSKLANVLFSRGLAQRLRGTRITSNALHPGVINTEIDRNLGRLTQWGFAALTAVSGKNIAEGAATSCYVATSKQLGSTSGRYFEDCNAVNVTGSFFKDDELANELWALSETYCGDDLVRHTRPDAPPVEASE